MSMSVEEVQCRWAEREYGLVEGSVEKVYFELGSHGPYSYETPDADAYLDVRVHLRSGRVISREETSPHDVIRKLCEFAAAA